MPSINSARYTQWTVQTVKSRMSNVSEKVHRLDPPSAAHNWLHDLQCVIMELLGQSNAITRRIERSIGENHLDMQACSNKQSRGRLGIRDSFGCFWRRPL